MNTLRFLISTVILFITINVSTGQIYLTEGFENGTKPEGWTEEGVSGNEPWRYRNGGHSPNDNNWLVPADEEDITRNPSSAYSGTYNAIFFKQGNNNERTKLITPEMDLLGGVNVELSFYLCQIPWTFEGSAGWDVLRVYYKTGAEDPWILLHEYLDPVYDWEKQILYLPDPNETYYVAFEGHTRWGYGTCVDEITIQETGSQSMYISEIEFEQPFSAHVPTGSVDVPLIRLNLKVLGNTDSIALDDITFTSLNTSDSDITPNSVKLYSTILQTFNTDSLVGTSTDFTSGTATFTGLNHYLPRGLSYLWLACDIEPDAVYGNILDVMVKANDIVAGDTILPVTDESPYGSRTIYKTIYSQGFEASHNWTLTGEFEVATPDGNGGTPGNPNPSEAYRGSKVLGTDLTGLGTFPYNYEPGLTDATSYLAVSPVIDAEYYKNLNLFYYRYINIEVWDKASFEISSDNGVTWNKIWENNSYLSDFQYELEQFMISDTYSRTDQLQFRFKLGPTDGVNNYSGWSIDEIYLTGEFISKDVGVSEWLMPQSGSGHTANDSVKVKIANYGGAEITDPVPVAFSLDGGVNWTVNHMRDNIPVGESVTYTFASTADFSSPGLYADIRAKTFLPGDQFLGNEEISFQLYSVPTHTPPHMENFETNDGYWRSFGINLWEHGSPTGTVINSASSGSNAWVTGLSQSYGAVISQQNQIIFEDDFESVEDWTFTGEFERQIPNNMYPPYFAYSGYYCIGTDISGLGDSLYKYENGITQGTAYTAESPAFDVQNYSNVNVNFARWFEVMEGDSVKLEVSPDGGINWYVLWRNSEGAISDQDFVVSSYPIDDSLTYTSTLSFRFSLFQSSAGGLVAEGMIIDDFSITGDLVDLSPAYLRSPSFDLTGLNNPVFHADLWVDTEDGMDGASLYYSLDDGDTWNPIINISGYDSYWNWYTGNYVEALGQDGWSGQTGQWTTVKHLLPAAVHNQDNVQFQFRFLTDKSNNAYNGIAVDDVGVMNAPVDVGIDQIISPVTSCYLSGQENFNVRFRNHGIITLQSGDTIRVAYHIERDDGFIQTAEEQVILTQTLAPGNTLDLALNSEFDFTSNGSYDARLHIIEPYPYFYGPVANDTAVTTIEVNKPELELGPDISTAQPDTVLLAAYSGVSGNSYLWQDNSTDSIFDVSTFGNYHVRVTNLLGCVAYDTVDVLQLVPDIGISELVSPASACELTDQLPVEITINNFGTDTLEITDTIFVFAEINEALVFEDTIVLTDRFVPGAFFNFTYTGVYDFSTTGDYQMKLYTWQDKDQVDSNDTLFHTLEVHGYPDIDLGPDTTVFAAEYILSPGPGYYEYLWQDGSELEEFVIEEAGSGTYFVRVSDINGCASYDTVDVTLNTADLALDKILSPVNACELSNSITIAARIRNAGNQAISTGETLTLGYTVNEGLPITEAFVLSEELPVGGTIDLTFSTSENVITGQWYDLAIFIQFAADAKPSNDTAFTSLGVYETPVVDLGEPTQVITDTEHTLDAGPGFVSYKWQDGSTGQTFTIDEPGIGNYNVTVIDVNGCSVYEEVQIMLAVPDVGIEALIYPSTTCSLTDAEQVEVAIRNYGNFGIEPGANLNVAYSINGAEAVVEGVPLAETFAGGEVINYTFTQTEDLSTPGHYEFVLYTVYDADLVETNDILFTTMDVWGGPEIELNNGQDTLYTNEPVTLSVQGGYSSYEWQDGSTDTLFSINEPGSGMYSVTVTAENGCVSKDSVFVVFDIPDLEILSVLTPVSACELGNNAQVSIGIRNNGYFNISTSETLTLAYSVNSQSSIFENFNLQSELVPGATTELTFTQGYDFSAVQDYDVSVSLIYNKDTDFSNNLMNKTVSVWGNPVVVLAGGADTVETNDLPYVLDAGSGFASYLWQDNSTESSYEVNAFGLFSVIVTDAEGCTGSDSVVITELVSNRDIQLLRDRITIYPNPVKEYLNILFEMDGEQEVIIELYDIVNKLLYRRDIDHKKDSEAILDVQNYTPGTYILRITADGLPVTYKIEIQ
ncbi:MAG: T9SS type A sorting domain-containing protein [Bacteroidales bacterium]